MKWYNINEGEGNAWKQWRDGGNILKNIDDSSPLQISVTQFIDVVVW